MLEKQAYCTLISKLINSLKEWIMRNLKIATIGTYNGYLKEDLIVSILKSLRYVYLV